MLDVVPRIIWFEPPERALADPVRFMAYAMTYARHEDMRVIRGHVSDADFREALDECSFADLGFMGQKFTWCKRLVGGVTV